MTSIGDFQVKSRGQHPGLTDHAFVNVVVQRWQTQADFGVALFRVDSFRISSRLGDRRLQRADDQFNGKPFGSAWCSWQHGLHHWSACMTVASAVTSIDSWG